MTFVLHPLSHYNSITKPHARFLLSLLEHLTIDFPSHFILSILDVYRDLAFGHFSVPFPASDHFTFMCAIDYATVKHSEAHFRLRQCGSATLPSRLAPSQSASSTSAPSSSMRDVSFRDIMAELQHMNACLDTLSTKLYLVNIRVGCIARW